MRTEHGNLQVCNSPSLNDISQADFYTIPLEGFDVVLGVKWLCTLGPVFWDICSLTMKFFLNGKKVLWKGQPPLAEARLSLMGTRNSNMIILDNLLVEYVDLFLEPSSLPPS